MKFLIVAVVMAAVNAAATYKDCVDVTYVRFDDDKCTKIYNGTDQKQSWPKSKSDCKKVNKTTDEMWQIAAGMTDAPTHVRHSCTATGYTVNLHKDDQCTALEPKMTKTIDFGPKNGTGNCTTIQSTDKKKTWYVALFTNATAADKVYLASGGKPANATNATGAIALKAAVATALAFFASLN